MSKEAGLRIFRLQDAPLLGDTDIQPLTSQFSETEAIGWMRKTEAGYSAGQEARVLAQVPGMTILQIWNKKGYPTPLHSHNVDCLYVVIAGAVTVGKQDLGPGDCFFVPANMPYTYKVGPEGSEIVEIRQAANWDLKLLARNPAYFDKAVQTIIENYAGWESAHRPSRRT